MGVPVMRVTKWCLSLNAGIDPVHINALLARQTLPEGWLAAVVTSEHHRQSVTRSGSFCRCKVMPMFGRLWRPPEVGRSDLDA